METIPIEIVPEIGKYLDMYDCISYFQCCKKNEILQYLIRDKIKKWDGWYKRQINKIKIIKKTDSYQKQYEALKIITNSEYYPYQDLLQKIIYFVFSRDTNLELVTNKYQAQWIEFVCTCVKIDNSYTINEFDCEQYDILLNKNSEWKFEDNKTMNYESFFRKIRRKKWKEMQKERQEKLKKWTAKCIFCTKKINAYSAFFSQSGMGPLCIPCIQDDDELEITEWQNYARLH